MKKHLTIDELESDGSITQIWALNNSANSSVGQPGDVHCPIPKINGTKLDPLTIPQSWLPNCLTNQVPRAQLLAASEFRNLVNSELVVLITKEYAQQISQQDGATEELERLAAMKRAVKVATQARTIAGSGAEIISTAEIDDVDAAPTTGPKELDQSFLMFAENLTLKGDIDALNLIRGRGKFTGAEFRHLKKTLHEKPKVVAFIQDRLDARKRNIAAKKAEA
jgi:hypothetical protein